MAARTEAERCARTAEMFPVPRPATLRGPAPDARFPLGDPRKPWWTYHDLAVVFAMSVERLKKVHMPKWQGDAFPLPLPWSLREKRWNPDAVLAWKARHERRMGAVPQDLVAINGGRP